MDFDYGQSPAMQALDELVLGGAGVDDLHDLAMERWEKLAPLFDDDVEQMRNIVGAACDTAVHGHQPLADAFVFGFQIGVMAQRIFTRRADGGAL